MKNNGNIKYVLIGAVSILWGFIGFKVYSTFFDVGDDVVSYPVAPLNTAPKALIAADSFELFLDYKDPFSVGSMAKPTPAPNARSTAVRRQSRKAIQWPQVRYSGKFINKSTGEIKGIIEIDGREYMVKKGDEHGGVKITKLKPEEVLLSYEGERKTIPIEN